MRWAALSNLPALPHAWFRMNSYNISLPKNECLMAATLYAAPIPPPAAAHGGIDDLLGLIQRYDVISLDIFDTLLARRVARPADVFELVGRMCAVPSFRRVRIEAELHARARRVNCTGHGEVSLDEIYFEVERLLPRHADRLRTAELEQERRLLYPNPAGVAAFQAAVVAGKQIVAISDMYLPSDVLRGLLHANGFPIRQVFVSCELGASKGDSGGAFHAVARRLGITPQQILHIGDNALADFEGALQAGCGAWLLVSRNDRLFRDLRFNQAAISALMEADFNLYGSFLIAWLGELLERDGTVDASRQFGRMYAAPYLFAFVSWLEQIRHKDGVRRLLLLTRDGLALQPLFALIGSDVEVEIMHSSRRMLYLATLEDNFPQTCADLACAAINRTARTFLNDLELEDGKPLLAALSRQIDLDRPIRTTDDSAVLAAALRCCRTELVTLARRERAALATYCEQLQVTMPDTAIVDCGWGLTTHRRLEQITGAQIRGYYIGTSRLSTTHHRIRSFLFSKNVPGSWHQLHIEFSGTPRTSLHLPRASRDPPTPPERHGAAGAVRPQQRWRGSARHYRGDHRPRGGVVLPFSLVAATLARQPGDIRRVADTVSGVDPGADKLRILRARCHPACARNWGARSEDNRRLLALRAQRGRRTDYAAPPARLRRLHPSIAAAVRPARDLAARPAQVPAPRG